MNGALALKKTIAKARLKREMLISLFDNNIEQQKIKMEKNAIQKENVLVV